MNIFEVLFFAAYIAAAVACGHFLSEKLGMLGWVIGFPLGIALIFGARKAVLWINNYWLRLRPLRPRCKLGRCDVSDYKSPDANLEGVFFVCRCGTKYFQSGGRFQEVGDKGQLIPYMKWSLLQGWQSDGSAPSGKVAVMREHSPKVDKVADPRPTSNSRE